MYTKESLFSYLEELKINPTGVLLVHSSYKSIGEVEGGADTVIDVLMEYMKEGTLIIPTHTWANVGIEADRVNTMDVVGTTVCIGIIPELFRKRDGVIRTLHPTHSVGVFGKNARELASGEEKVTTPCGRNSIMGKLLDNKGTILLLGVGFIRNTYIHGVEEWNDVPGRLSENVHDLYVRTHDGEVIPTPQNRHCGELGSSTYWKLEDFMKEKGAMQEGNFGDAKAMVCNAEKLYEVLSKMLAIDKEILTDNEPLNKDWASQIV